MTDWLIDCFDDQQFGLIFGEITTHSNWLIVWKDWISRSLFLYGPHNGEFPFLFITLHSPLIGQFRKKKLTCFPVLDCLQNRKSLSERRTVRSVLKGILNHPLSDSHFTLSLSWREREIFFIIIFYESLTQDNTLHGSLDPIRQSCRLTSSRPFHADRGTRQTRMSTKPRDLLGKQFRESLKLPNLWMKKKKYLLPIFQLQV